MDWKAGKPAAVRVESGARPTGRVSFKCTYMNSAPISKPLRGVQTRLVPIRASLRLETPTAPPKPASAWAG